MKKCKECGKLFVPKSKNSVYCDAVHYRPCPVCGKPVEAKYLSDPARCCSKECQHMMRKQNKPTVNAATIVKPSENIQIEVQDGDTVVNVLSQINKHSIHPNLSPEGKFVLEDSDVRTFVGKSSCKFVEGHAYAIKVSRDLDYGTYLVNGYYDLTEDKECDALSVQASMISLNQFFLPISKQIVVAKEVS